MKTSIVGERLRTGRRCRQCYSQHLLNYGGGKDERCDMSRQYEASFALSESETCLSASRAKM